MKLPEPPKHWGTDELTGFIDNTRLNCFATYTKLPSECTKLNTIDRLFRNLADNLYNTKDWFAAFFLLKAHSAFLAGCHLAMSGQVTEVYAALRLCIEHGLYGHYLSRHPTSREIWLRRHDNEQAKRRVKSEFTIRNLLDTLRQYDRKEATVAEQLYERCIDYGAHPNERALTQSLKKETKQDKIDFQIIYLSADPTMMRVCLKTAAQVGTSALGIFRQVFRERFDLTGLTDQLVQVRKGL